jgi:hypothetical protein
MSDQPDVAVRVATSGYFETMRIPLVRECEPRPADSDSMARTFCPGDDPIGMRLTLTFRPDARSALMLRKAVDKRAGRGVATRPARPSAPSQK